MYVFLDNTMDATPAQTHSGDLRHITFCAAKVKPFTALQRDEEAASSAGSRSKLWAHFLLPFCLDDNQVALVKNGRQRLSQQRLALLLKAV